jgi:hypothetical protein
MRQRGVTTFMMILLVATAISLAGSAVMGTEVSLPDFSGSVFAAEIVAGDYSGWASFYCNRCSVILGPPLATSAYEQGYLSLGMREFVIVRMETPFRSGEGMDIRIYEWGYAWGGCDESFTVYVSQDGLVWHRLSIVEGAWSSSPFVPYELGDLEGTFEFIKLVGREDECCPANDPDEPEHAFGFIRAIRRDDGCCTPCGPEIFAIEALHPVED